MRSVGRNIVIFCICCMNFWACNQIVMGQEDQSSFEDQLLVFEIAEKLISYNDQLTELQESVSQGSQEDLSTLDKHVASIDVKWNFYKDGNQVMIMENDSLLQIVADYEILKQELIDSITVKKQYFEAEKNMVEAEKIFSSQDSVYAQLYQEALEYSLVKDLAPLLEKLKIKEQILFAELQEEYVKSKAVGEEYPMLLQRSQKLEEQFIDLKSSSEKIQALEYKPLFQRIKDYLFGLAAVAMILMFISVIQSKIKVWRQNVENAKKMREMMKQGEDDYPTI